MVNSIEKELILNRVGGFLFLLFVFNYTIDLFFWECPKMRKTYLFKDDGRRDVYMYVCLFVGKEGKMRFRAAHDQLTRLDCGRCDAPAPNYSGLSDLPLLVTASRRWTATRTPCP